MGYQIFAFIPTHLYQIISDFPEPTHPPNRRISYVDGPLEEQLSVKALLILSNFKEAYLVDSCLIFDCSF